MESEGHGDEGDIDEADAEEAATEFGHRVRQQSGRRGGCGGGQERAAAEFVEREDDRKERAEVETCLLGRMFISDMDKIFN